MSHIDDGEVAGFTRPAKNRETGMKRNFCGLAAASALLVGLSLAQAAYAQKQGGVLKIYFFDSPASLSIHEETTAAGQGPAMGIFNNLVLYKQDVPQSSLQSIVPDLASEWSWDEDKTQLTFRLREGVRWHDGKPFTAKDVLCIAQCRTPLSGEISGKAHGITEMRSTGVLRHAIFAHRPLGIVCRGKGGRQWDPISCGVSA